METPVSAEQVEAAKKFMTIIGGPWTPKEREAFTVEFAAFLAARDAERDARWEAKVRGLVESINGSFSRLDRKYGNVHTEWQDARDDIAALANLGAEEKSNG